MEGSYSILKTAALVIFFAAFVIILLRLVFSSRTKYDEAARLPLDDGKER
jgi:cbb3-type cytochrome oxidase subunit 3